MTLMATPTDPSATAVPPGAFYTPQATAADIAKSLTRHADAAFGGTQAGGAYTGKDAADVLELAVNQMILAQPKAFDPTADAERAARILAALEQVTNTLPTQTKRDEEQERLQQYSTPPHYAYLVAWAADLDRGEKREKLPRGYGITSMAAMGPWVRRPDMVLEPSAGTGGLIVHALNGGCEVWANELSERRAKLLRSIPGMAGAVFTENAEQLHNLLRADIRPTVILMNPPFSVSANHPGKRVSEAGCVHVEQALKRLEPGGRLVAILHAAMAPARNTFAGWWNRIRQAHSVRANLGIPGDVCRKYGTTISADRNGRAETRLVVIDKTTPAASLQPVVADVDLLAEAVTLLAPLRDRRLRAAVDAGPPSANAGGPLADDDLERQARLAAQRRFREGFPHSVWGPHTTKSLKVENDGYDLILADERAKRRPEDDRRAAKAARRVPALPAAPRRKRAHAPSLFDAPGLFDHLEREARRDEPVRTTTVGEGHAAGVAGDQGGVEGRGGAAGASEGDGGGIRAGHEEAPPTTAGADAGDQPAGRGVEPWTRERLVKGDNKVHYVDEATVARVVRRLNEIDAWLVENGADLGNLWPAASKSSPLHDVVRIRGEIQTALGEVARSQEAISHGYKRASYDRHFSRCNMLAMWLKEPLRLVAPAQSEQPGPAKPDDIEYNGLGAILNRTNGTGRANVAPVAAPAVKPAAAAVLCECDRCGQVHHSMPGLACPVKRCKGKFRPANEPLTPDEQHLAGLLGLPADARPCHGHLHRLVDVAEAVTQETWQAAYSVIVAESHTTLWQRVLEVDPTYVRAGPVDGEPWPLPSLYTVRTALGLPTAAPPASEPAPSGPIIDAVFEPYRPQRLPFDGAQPHPTPLVQSAAMASVQPPAPTYVPKLPQDLIARGVWSDAQLEGIVYAGQSHAQHLPEQPAPGGTGLTVRYRKGWFCGDSTGVGKGREACGIVLDNFARGGRKALWVSKSPNLIKDALRDWRDVGGNPADIVELSKIKAGEPIKAAGGILFCTYGALKSDRQGKKNKSRLKQIVDWLGDGKPERFDGVILFDEAHQMRSAIARDAGRGRTPVSQAALAGCDLQHQLPDARVVYLSATGATHVHNLAYCHRLSLWGRGTAFADQQAFVTGIEAGGLAAMELVARDLKERGLYISRSLSFDGVEYDRLTHELSPDQREIYDKLCEAWQLVLRRFDDGLELVANHGYKNGKPQVDGKAKGAAYSAFWGAHQRFFNQILTAMQMPSAIADIERQIDAGHCAVLQLVNTNEAAQERQLAKLMGDEESDLADIDLTPRDQLLQLVEHCFPVVQMESYTEAGSDTVRMRPVSDKKGNPVLNKEAVALRDKLLDELASIRVPDGPLEMLLGHFGDKNVAEVTGRSRRVVRVTEDGVTKTVIQPRSQAKCAAEAAEFQEGKRLILVFSDAGGTGRSYHASRQCGNQRRRIHYLIQAGWVADMAIQGFGRTHRSDQAVAPLYKLVSTDLKGQKRFISTIARRLDQLGALTKGQRQAAGQGLFNQLTDNLEGEHARAALTTLYKDIYYGKVAGLSLDQFQQQTGLKIVDNEGRLAEQLPPITRWLNRLLSLCIEPQNALFDAFQKRLDAVVKKAMEEGTLDLGVETLLSDKAQKLAEQVVYTDPASGARTRLVKLKLSWRNQPWSFEQLLEQRDATRWDKIVLFARNRRSDHVYAFTDAGDRTMQNGSVLPHYYEVGPVSRRLIPKREVDDPQRWEKLERVTSHVVDRQEVKLQGKPIMVPVRGEVREPDLERARALWDAQLAHVPEFGDETLNLMCGTLLPIWDRLKGNPKVKRLATTEPGADGSPAGERFLGRVIPEEELHDTLTRLGVEAAAEAWTAERVVARLAERTHVFHLANGWQIKTARVSGETRYEIVGCDYRDLALLKVDGVFFERIQHAGRFFVPVGEQAVEVVRRVIEHRPVAKAVRVAAAAAGRVA